MIFATRVVLSVLVASGVTWVAEHVHWLAAVMVYIAIDVAIAEGW